MQIQGASRIERHQHCVRIFSSRYHRIRVRMCSSGKRNRLSSTRRQISLTVRLPATEFVYSCPSWRDARLSFSMSDKIVVRCTRKICYRFCVGDLTSRDSGRDCSYRLTIQTVGTQYSVSTARHATSQSRSIMRLLGSHTTLHFCAGARSTRVQSRSVDQPRDSQRLCLSTWSSEAMLDSTRPANLFPLWSPAGHQYLTS